MNYHKQKTSKNKAILAKNQMISYILDDILPRKALNLYIQVFLCIFWSRFLVSLFQVFRYLSLAEQTGNKEATKRL